MKKIAIRMTNWKISATMFEKRKGMGENEEKQENAVAVFGRPSGGSLYYGGFVPKRSDNAAV